MKNRPDLSCFVQDYKNDNKKSVFELRYYLITEVEKGTNYMPVNMNTVFNLTFLPNISSLRRDK